MDETELSKHEWNLKEQDFLITIYHGKFAKRPEHTTVVQTKCFDLYMLGKNSIICADPDP